MHVNNYNQPTSGEDHRILVSIFWIFFDGYFLVIFCPRVLSKAIYNINHFSIGLNPQVKTIHFNRYIPLLCWKNTDIFNALTSFMNVLVIYTHATRAIKNNYKYFWHGRNVCCTWPCVELKCENRNASSSSQGVRIKEILCVLHYNLCFIFFI